MMTTKNKIKLVNLMLDKRDVTKGGVEGFFTPITLTIKEVEDRTGLNKDELFNILDDMKKTIAKDSLSGEDTVIDDYLISVKVLSSSTEKLKHFKKNLSKK